MCSVDHYILTEDILVADDEACLVALVVEVLRLRTEHGVLIHLVATTHNGALHDAHVGEDDAVIADNHVVLYVCERVDCDILANLCARGYVCFITNHN